MMHALQIQKYTAFEKVVVEQLKDSFTIIVQYNDTCMAATHNV